MVDPKDKFEEGELIYTLIFGGRSCRASSCYTTDNSQSVVWLDLNPIDKDYGSIGLKFTAHLLVVWDLPDTVWRNHVVQKS